MPKGGATLIDCLQRPNHEGLLLRMMPGLEHENPSSNSAKSGLKNRWPAYEKPANANALARQFSLEDLLRMASNDADVRIFLNEIGLM